MDQPAETQAPTLTVAEALAMLQKVSGSASLVQYQVTRGVFEHIPWEAEHGREIKTQQNTGLHEQNGIARTEFRQTIPIAMPDQKPKDNPKMSVGLVFATMIVYSFPETFSDQERSVFTKIMSVVHSWPYYRTFSLGWMAQMGVVPVMQPLIQPPLAAQMAGFAPNPEEPSEASPSAPSRPS